MPFEKGSRQDPHLFQRCSQLSASIRKCLISDLERHILLAFSSLEFGGWDREACYLSNPLTEKKIDVIISSYGIHTIKSEDWTPTPKQSKKTNGKCKLSMQYVINGAPNRTAFVQQWKESGGTECRRIFPSFESLHLFICLSDSQICFAFLKADHIIVMKDQMIASLLFILWAKSRLVYKHLVHNKPVQRLVEDVTVPIHVIRY